MLGKEEAFALGKLLQKLSNVERDEFVLTDEYKKVFSQKTLESFNADLQDLLSFGEQGEDLLCAGYIPLSSCDSQSGPREDIISELKEKIHEEIDCLLKKLQSRTDVVGLRFGLKPNSILARAVFRENKEQARLNYTLVGGKSRKQFTRIEDACRRAAKELFVQNNKYTPFYSKKDVELNSGKKTAAVLGIVKKILTGKMLPDLSLDLLYRLKHNMPHYTERAIEDISQYHLHASRGNTEWALGYKASLQKTLSEIEEAQSPAEFIDEMVEAAANAKQSKTNMSQFI